MAVTVKSPVLSAALSQALRTATVLSGIHSLHVVSGIKEETEDLRVKLYAQGCAAVR